MAKERASRSDRGVTVFTKDFFKYVLGLSDKTVKELMSKIQNRGEMATMKKAIRDLSGDTYKRLNMALDMAEEVAMAGSEEESDDEDVKKDEPKKEAKKDEKEEKDVKEGYTFMRHLLNEVTMDIDLNDPAQAMVDVKKASRRRPQQRELDQKKMLNLKQRELQQSDSPTKNLEKKKLMLQKQLAQVEKQLSIKKGAA